MRVVAMWALLPLLVLAGRSGAQADTTRSLFNGLDLSGWHADVPAADDKPGIEPSFMVRDGLLVSLGNPAGHLITDAIYQDYRLDVEYRFVAAAGNCGVLVHASTPRALYGMFPASIEVQMHSGNAGDFWCIGENIAVDNMAARRSGEPQTWGGGPQDSRRILNLTDDSERPVGEWNRMVIEALGNRVRVWVNGDLVNDGFDCTARRGQIAVQAEGTPVEFRRLDLTPIESLTPTADAEVELGFEAGTIGQTPDSWLVPTPGWTAELIDATAAEGERSLELKQREVSDAPFGNVMCVLDAAPYRGRTVTLSAKLRVQGGVGSQAMMWLRADLDDGTWGAFYNMQDRPIRPAAPGDGSWTDAAFTLDIEPNAAQLAIGFVSIGGATVSIDSARLLAGQKTPEPAPQAPGELRPLSARGEQNLEAATRLLAYVRFFHASDQSAAVKDWDHLAVGLVERTEGAVDAADLAGILTGFFAPLAPTLQVWAGGLEDAPPLFPQPEGVNRVVYWEHTGVGNLSGRLDPNVYTSEVKRDLLPATLPWGKRELDADSYAASFVLKPLGGGVSCRLPVRVFADNGGTRPHVSRQTEWSTAIDRAELSAESRATRLAGVALCWGVLQHFYPYFDVVETDWDAALTGALRAAAEDSGRLEYLHTLQELIAGLHDGHGHVFAPGVEPRTMIPLAFTWVGDELVIAGRDESVAGEVAVGDAVIEIEGKSVGEWRDELSERVSAATEGWRRVRLAREFAYSIPSGAGVRVKLRRPGGEEYEAELPRIASTTIASRTDRKPGNGQEIAPGIVYFNLDGASAEDLDAAMPRLAAAEGIVFDLRGYPGTAGTEVVRHLTGEIINSARWNIPVATLPDRQGWEWKTDGRWVMPPLEPRLTPHVAFLTDGRAISYAESIMGIVEAYHLGEIVGSTTAGTNGNVNPFDLPGGYRVVWTGMKTLKHDGSPHHGVGIAPSVAVEPTVAGIAAGRDEVLEEGVKVLEKRIAADRGD